MDDVSIGIYILLVALIAMSAFFSATETAFSSFNRIRMKNYAGEGNRKAEKALKIADDYDRALSAILIGNNIVNIASASIGTMIFTAWFGASGVGISTLFMTIIVLIFGEILPKTMAKENAESFAMAVADVLWAIIFILTPLIAIFIRLKNLVVRKKSGEDTPSVTQEELKYIIEEIEDEGVLKEQESELLQSALEFEEITVDEILTPRVDLIAVEIDDPIEEIKDLFLKHRFSRMPVYEESIDNIVGILYEREFFRAMIEGTLTDIRPLIKRTIYVPEKQRISAVLRELQSTKIHMAIVTDSYGGTRGIVTLEDIVEELVGEIWDEKDEVIDPIKKLGENTYLVDGDLNVHDMLEMLDVELRDFEPESNTVGGWALEVMRRIPNVGERFSYESLTVTISELDDQRVEKVTVVIDPAEQEEETDSREK